MLLVNHWGFAKMIHLTLCAVSISRINSPSPSFDREGLILVILFESEYDPFVGGWKRAPFIKNRINMPFSCNYFEKITISL